MLHKMTQIFVWDFFFRNCMSNFILFAQRFWSRMNADKILVNYDLISPDGKKAEYF